MIEVNVAGELREIFLIKDFVSLEEEKSGCIIWLTHPYRINSTDSYNSVKMKIIAEL